jgi:glycosyltransferase involved in cell wall biosynthesis/tetratricopeptide (TPR) repeat protein
MNGNPALAGDHQPGGDDDGVLRSLGNLLRQGHYAQARILSEKATRTFPGSARAWLLHAEALRRCQVSSEAVRAYEKALALDPELLVAHDRLAWLHVSNRAFARAAEHHCVLLERAGDIPFRILTEACDCFEHVLRGEAPSPELQKHLKRSIDPLLRRYWAAVDSCEDAAEKYVALCRIGRLCALGKDYSRATAAFSQAVQLDGRHPAARVGLADNLHALARDVEAVSHLREAVRNNSDDPGLRKMLDHALAGRRIKRARLIAFYLPQYHPIPENDRWWGKGFTDWSNVAAARPLWGGHLQPRQPTALGYYDLRLPDAANQQFELARRYGVDAFCYYYYWFNGRRLLEKPLDDLAQGRSGPFPFCICWVNEEWRRNWDGLSGEVLLPLEHSRPADEAFIKDVLPLLKHPDYVRVDGRPMLLVYRAGKLAEPKATAATWRTYCRENGIDDIYLCAVQSFGFCDPAPVGFDAAVEFPPHAPNLNLPDVQFHQELSPPPDAHPLFQGKVWSYPHLADCFMRRPSEDYVVHRTCMLAWDNTARRGKDAHMYGDFTVAKYEQWLVVNVAKSVAEQSDPVVFINAWNEWGEGSALEPDRFFGYELLERTRTARKRGIYAAFGTHWTGGEPLLLVERVEPAQRLVLVGHDALLHGAQVNLLNMARSFRRMLGMEVAIILLAGGELVREYEKVGPTVVLDSGEAGPEQLRAHLWHYAAMGASKAVCNTTVTGELVQVVKGSGYRVCGLVHELPSLIESKGLERQCQAMAEQSDALVFGSEVVKSAFTERYQVDPSKVLVAPQGIAFNPYWSNREPRRLALREGLGWAPETLIIMGCGYGDTRKGIDLFVLVAAQAVRRLPAKNVAFLWVGDLDQALAPYVAADILRLGLSAKFRITGKVSDPAHYFAGCDVFALTSREDPFPSVVMEAFEAGMPVVAFDGGGGYVDIVSDESGALVPYLDVAAFAAALAELLEDDERRTAIGIRNHAYSQEHFGYEPYLRKLLALLDGVPASVVARGQLTRVARTGLSVSVVVPNYNYGRYLELRLRTIWDQTLRVHEIIVLDDASTDYSPEIIEAMAEISPVPCRVIRNERNSGNAFAQWAAGLQAASGDLVWIAEADDYCEPVFLERLVPLFDDAEVTLAFTDSVMVDARGGSAGFRYREYHRTLHGDRFDASFTISGTELLNHCLFINNVIPNASAAVFRREAMLADLSELARYHFSGDWWFWINLAGKGRVAYADEPLNYHRRHDQSVMGEVLQDPQKLISETIAFYRRILARKVGEVETRAARQMIERLRAIFKDYRDVLEAEDIEDHPELGSLFAELRGQVAELSDRRANA